MQCGYKICNRAMDAIENNTFEKPVITMEISLFYAFLSLSPSLSCPARNKKITIPVVYSGLYFSVGQFPLHSCVRPHLLHRFMFLTFVRLFISIVNDMRTHHSWYVCVCVCLKCNPFEQRHQSCLLQWGNSTKKTHHSIHSIVVCLSIGSNRNK